MKQVEILFFEGCPNVELATSRARQTVASAGVQADVRLVRIEGEGDAGRRPETHANGKRYRSIPFNVFRPADEVAAPVQR